MLLSAHISLEEMIATQHRGVDNTPSAEIIENLKRTAAVLEQVRMLLGTPIHVNSGFRSEALNKIVGGQASSQHCQGLAADFISPKWPLIEIARIVQKNVIFDQLIFEFGTWIHLSTNPLYRPPRRQSLMIGGWTKGRYEPLDLGCIENLTLARSTG